MKKIFKTLVFATLGIMALASCEDVPAPYKLPSNNGNNGGGNENPETIIGDGTYSNPFNVAAANKATSELQPSNTSETFLSDELYVKGIISQIESIDTGNYGNATYYISDDGSTANQLEVYRGYGFDGAKFKSETDINVGDTVIVCGKLQNWLGKTYEFTTGSKIVYLNGKTSGAPTPPTPGTEITCAKAVELTNALADGAISSETYTVIGYITEIVGSVSRNQQTFWMADTKDGGKVFEAYWANLPEGVSEFTVGSKVKITGNLTKYVKDGKMTPEIKNADVVILESGGSSTTPTEAGTVDAPYSVAKALEIINAGTYTKDKVYVSGIISKIDEISLQYGNATYYISDDGKTTTQLEVFRGYGLGGEKFTTEDDIMVGDKVIILGVLTMYNTTPEITTGSQIYSLNGEKAGGSQGGSETAGNSITFSEKGYSNAQDFDGQSISVGDATLSWSKGSGSTTPKYYTTGNAMRLYGGNTLTISSQKTISKVEFTYGEDYNGTSYTPTASDSSVTPDGYNYSTHTWTGSAQSIVLSRTASTGHFRIVSIKISYAQ